MYGSAIIGSMVIRVFLLSIMLLPAWGRADEIAQPADSVENNIRNLDQDHDGMVSIAEIRTYLEVKNGKGYRSELLDDMQARAEGRSCGSPFSRSFY